MEKSLARQKGKLIKWDAEKAFGFIASNTSNKHVFIHKTGFDNKTREPKVGDLITFSLSSDKNGRECASDASFSGERLTVKKGTKKSAFSLYASATFVLAILLAYATGFFPREILIAYTLLSVITFFAYWWDKSKAKRGKWRTQESTLHLLSLIGGWPGAAFAQQKFRHKTSKKPFQITYWFTVLLNLAGLAYLLNVLGIVT